MVQMHFLRMLLVMWFSFGVLTIFAFLWLGKKGVQALSPTAKKEAGFDLHQKRQAVVTSNAA
jgi:hypothetical protein